MSIKDIECARQLYEDGKLQLEVGHIALLKQLNDEEKETKKKKPFQFTLHYSCEKIVTVMACDEDEAREMVECGDYEEEGEYDNFDLQYMKLY